MAIPRFAFARWLALAVTLHALDDSTAQHLRRQFMDHKFPKKPWSMVDIFFLEKIDLQLQGNEPYIYWSFCRQMWAAVTGTLCPTCRGETAMFFTPVFTLTGGMQQPHFSNFGDQTGFSTCATTSQRRVSIRFR